MFTVRRIGWTLTGGLAVLWTIVVVALIRTNDPPPGSDDRPLLFQVLGSWVLIGLLWIALVLIALIWIVLWFGGGLVGGLRGQKSESSNHPARDGPQRPPRQA